MSMDEYDTELKRMQENSERWKKLVALVESVSKNRSHVIMWQGGASNSAFIQVGHQVYSAIDLDDTVDLIEEV